MLITNRPTRRRAGVLAAVTAVVAAVLLLVSALAGSSAALASPSARAQVGLRAARAAPPPAVTGNECPYIVFNPKATAYPAIPSFHAGYIQVMQKLNAATADWAYVYTADYPYANWFNWTLYNTAGEPMSTINRLTIQADPGSENPFETGVPVLWPKRSYHLYYMPATTPPSVLTAMKNRYGEGNVQLLLPLSDTNPGVSVQGRVYWTFKFNGGSTAGYDQFGYGGPTKTPFPAIHAFLVNPKTGALTDTPVGDCGAQSQIPKRFWYNRATGRPMTTASKIPRPIVRPGNIPNFLLNNGIFSAVTPAYDPPSYVKQYVEFYRPASNITIYANMSRSPPAGNPPDACAPYLMANLPNNVVSVIHMPEVPTFPNYTGATSGTLRTNDTNVQFVGLEMYGVNRQVYGYGSSNPVRALRNSQLGNQEIAKNSDKSATFVIYPPSATPAQVVRINSIVKANGWNILHGGVKTRFITTNLLGFRENGQNNDWVHAMSANDVTQGAPCPQSFEPDLPMNEDPPSAQATQDNGMGLTTPNGQNCTIASFTSGRCLQALITQYKTFNWKWNAAGTFPTGQL